jgi:hypothetical protein
MTDKTRESLNKAIFDFCVNTLECANEEDPPEQEEIMSLPSLIALLPVEDEKRLKEKMVSFCLDVLERRGRWRLRILGGLAVLPALTREIIALCDD